MCQTLYLFRFSPAFLHVKYKGLQTGYASCSKNIFSNSKDVSNSREAAVAIAGANETILETQVTEGCQQQYLCHQLKAHNQQQGCHQ
jgi:hypothetical protein